VITSRSNLLWTEWFYPLMENIDNQRLSQETIYKSAQWCLFSFYSSEKHLYQLAWTPTSWASSKKPTARSYLPQLIPTNTLISRRSKPREEDESANEVCLPPWTFPRAKWTSGEDSLQLKHFWDDMLSLDWREHIVGIHSTAWCAFTSNTSDSVKSIHRQDLHNSADRLWWWQ
jgi:hypothetical protein